MDNEEKEQSESAPLNRPDGEDPVLPNYYPPPTNLNQPLQPPPGYYYHPGQGYFPYPPNSEIPNSNNNQHNDNRNPPEHNPRRSKQLYCSNCNRYGWTRVTFKTGLANHLCCGYLCLIGCWLCCWIPYFTDYCKDSDHFCGFCNTLIKTESPL